MSDEEAQNLAKLSKREREVLWLVCEGNSYDDISKKLFISIPTVKANMGRIYVKLGLDQLSKAERVKAIHQIYCPLMRNTELPPEPTEPIKPEPVPEPVSRMVDEDEYAIVPYQPKPSDVIVIDTKVTRPRRSGLPFLVWLLMIGLVGGIVYLLINNFQNRQPTQTALELTRVVAQLTQVAAVPSLELPTQTLIAPTTAPTTTVFVPTVTNTLPPPPTLTPTNPPPTPAPTLTLGPVISLPFSDNFDNGPSSQWKVLSGNWITVGGKYTPTGNDNGWSLSALDDPTWKNYRIQVDINIPHQGSGAQGNFGIVVRNSPGHSKFFGFAVDGLSRGFWSNITMDDWNPYPIADFGAFKVPSDFRLDLEVRGNQFVARVNGQEIQSMSMSGYESGGIILGVTCDSSFGCPNFDNLNIDPLP